MLTKGDLMKYHITSNYKARIYCKYYVILLSKVKLDNVEDLMTDFVEEAFEYKFTYHDLEHVRVRGRVLYLRFKFFDLHKGIIQMVMNIKRKITYNLRSRIPYPFKDIDLWLSHIISTKKISKEDIKELEQEFIGKYITEEEIINGSQEH